MLPLDGPVFIAALTSERVSTSAGFETSVSFSLKRTLLASVSSSKEILC